MSHSNSIGKHRLAIAEHFRLLVRKQDFAIETEILANKSNENELNERRELYLNEIKDCEQANMKYLEQTLIDNLRSLTDLPDDCLIQQLLIDFCYVIKYKEIHRVVITNRFLTEEQTRKFEMSLQLALIVEKDLKQLMIREILDL